MKMNSDYANKTISNLQSEISSILQAEENGKTYSCGGKLQFSATL